MQSKRKLLATREILRIQTPGNVDLVKIQCEVRTLILGTLYIHVLGHPCMWPRIQWVIRKPTRRSGTNIEDLKIAFYDSSASNQLD